MAKEKMTKRQKEIAIYQDKIWELEQLIEHYQLKLHAYSDIEKALKASIRECGVAAKNLNKTNLNYRQLAFSLVLLIIVCAGLFIMQLKY